MIFMIGKKLVPLWRYQTPEGERWMGHKESSLGFSSDSQTFRVTAYSVLTDGSFMCRASKWTCCRCGMYLKRSKVHCFIALGG